MVCWFVFPSRQFTRVFMGFLGYKRTVFCMMLRILLNLIVCWKALRQSRLPHQGLLDVLLQGLAKGHPRNDIMIS